MTNLDPTPYAVRAEQHWKRLLPGEYRKIPPEDRPGFFNRIGTEIEQQIEIRTSQISGDDPDGPPAYMDNLARLMTARREAELEVLGEMLPAPPDPEKAQEPASR
jgi:hypothetical protein